MDNMLSEPVARVLPVKESELWDNIETITDTPQIENPHLYARRFESGIIDVLKYEHTVDCRIAPKRGIYTPTQLNELVDKLFPWAGNESLLPEINEPGRIVQDRLYFPRIAWT